MSNAFEKWFKKNLPKSYSDKQRDKVWDDICKKIKEDERKAKEVNHE